MTFKFGLWCDNLMWLVRAQKWLMLLIIGKRHIVLLLFLFECLIIKFRSLLLVLDFFLDFKVFLGRSSICLSFFSSFSANCASFSLTILSKAYLVSEVQLRYSVQDRVFLREDALSNVNSPFHRHSKWDTYGKSEACEKYKQSNEVCVLLRDAVQSTYST